MAHASPAGRLRAMVLVFGGVFRAETGGGVGEEKRMGHGDEERPVRAEGMIVQGAEMRVPMSDEREEQGTSCG